MTVFEGGKEILWENERKEHKIEEELQHVIIEK